MKVEQFVMAYEAEQDRIRAMLPDGFISLRPVLRINTEIRQTDGRDEQIYIEFNAPVESDGKRGWINIGHWETPETDISCTRETGKNNSNSGRIAITTDFLRLTYAGTGLAGGCPAEKDNDGCFFINAEMPAAEKNAARETEHAIGKNAEFRPAEIISENKEFCDCEFAWTFSGCNAHGKSTGKTLPAYNEKEQTCYERQAFTPENAAAIPCRQVLGSYIVRFER